MKNKYKTEIFQLVTMLSSAEPDIQTQSYIVLSCVQEDYFAALNILTMAGVSKNHMLWENIKGVLDTRYRMYVEMKNSKDEYTDYIDSIYTECLGLLSVDQYE